MFDEHVLVTLRTFRTKPIKSAEDELKTDNANASDFGECNKLLILIKKIVICLKKLELLFMTEDAERIPK